MSAERVYIDESSEPRTELEKLLTRDEINPGRQIVNSRNCKNDRLAEDKNEVENVKLGCGDCTNCQQPGVSKFKRLNMSLKSEESQNFKKAKISDERTSEKIKILSVFDVGAPNKCEEKISDNVLVSERSKLGADCLDLSGIVPLQQVPSTLADEDGDVEKFKYSPLQKSTFITQKTRVDICTENSRVSVSQSSSKYMSLPNTQDSGNKNDVPFVKVGEFQNTATHEGVAGSRMLMSILARKDFLERQKLMFLAVLENIEKQRKHQLEYFDAETVSVKRQIQAVNEELLLVYKQV